jgi:4-methylaminobutanoate oxidase (formaldehyde-forming)
MTMRDLAVGDVPVRAARDLHGSWDGSLLPDRVRRGCGGRAREAEEPHASAAGYRAIDTLRLEKGYRVWAADIATRRPTRRAWAA